jgi:hypothetical protein
MQAYHDDPHMQKLIIDEVNKQFGYRDREDWEGLVDRVYNNTGNVPQGER